jgi:hypothetical protein
MTEAIIETNMSLGTIKISMTADTFFPIASK